MRGLDFGRIKGVIWDLDNTLYRFNDLFVKACSLASARAAVAMGVPLNEKEAERLANESFYQHGYSGYVFEKTYGLNQEIYHHKYHELIDEKILEVQHDMAAILRKLKLPHVILTNGSRPWAQRILAYQNLTEFFPEDRIVAQEDAAFIPKARGTYGFEIAQERLGLAADQILMVDDMTKNLRIPKDMGMQTAFIHHGAQIDTLPDYVDEAFSDTLILTKNMVESQFEDIF